MATLTYSHFSNPGRRRHRAHYTIVHKKAWRELSFYPSIVRLYSIARDCLSDRPRRAAAGGHMLSAAGFLTLYICIYRSHRYLHAKFQKDWPEKKLDFFIQSCSALFLLQTVHKKAFFLLSMVQNYASAHKCLSRRPHSNSRSVKTQTDQTREWYCERVHSHKS